MTNDLFFHLSTAVHQITQENYPFQSRVHPLHSMPAFVKRDDELGFGITGSKIRKYRTLIPELRKYRQILVIGGAQSNHVLGISQLLRENQIPFKLLLREGFAPTRRGNSFLLPFLVDDADRVVISRYDWPKVEDIAEEMRRGDDRVFVMTEGAFCYESLLGALTLPLDIIRNEKEKGFAFDRIFVDAGTGLTAIGLILGLHYLQHPAQVRVLLLADTEEEFSRKMKKCLMMFEGLIQEQVSLPDRYRTFFPKNAASFGSTNQTLFQEMRDFMHEEGFFIDPIYSGKLFIESRRVISKETEQKKRLIIHSGGCFSLFGYDKWPTNLT